MNKFGSLRFWMMVLLALVVAAGMAACDFSSSSDKSDNSGGGGSGGGGGSNSKLAGTWALSQGGGVEWYIHFYEDNAWRITNNADGSGQRVLGTYTVSGNTFKGPMQNPGTGVGEIQGTVDGSSLTLDFIEHWHTPHKVIKYTGQKT